jgi:Flp pilus assembly protein TadG
MLENLYRNVSRGVFSRWFSEEKGTAFTEAVILLPVMVTLLMGAYDIGQGITTNQKVIGSSQIMGDLIARDRSVDMSGLQDIIKAGEMSVQPYNTSFWGYDIVSIVFDEDGNPEVLWRVTDNTQQNDAAVESAKGLGTEGDGLVIVTAAYTYRPFFMNFFTSDIDMREVAFLHGRRSATVACGDCPSG